jgi:RND family efflux transporter MFP subunit
MLRSPRTRKWWFLNLLSLVALVGCTPSPAATPPEAPRVTVARPVERKLVDYDEFFGWLAAAETVEVRSRVRGHIDKVHFSDGDIVEENELLFELDRRPYQAEVDRAREDVKVFQAQREVAVKEEARVRELFARKVATEAELEQAAAEVLVLDAQVAAGEEEIKRRQLDVDFCRIYAPIAGRIGRAQLTRGNLVNAGGSDPLLTTIVSHDNIKVYFFVDERTLQRYQRQQRTDEQPGGRPALKDKEVAFEFGLETDEGYPHAGKLDFAENRVDPTTGTIEVRGEADENNPQFIPGLRVRVRVPVSASYAALVVPETAILSDQDKRYLLLLGADNVVLRRDIVPGKPLGDGMQVILPAEGGEAVTVADRVIVLGLQRARVNYPVQPLDADGNPVPAAAP